MPRDKFKNSRQPKKSAAGRSQPNPKRQVARQPRQRRSTFMVPRGLHFFNANDPRHLPLPCRVAPYVVQRFIVNYQITTNPVDNVVVLIGGTVQQNTTAGNTNSISDVVAFSGVGTQLLSAANLVKSPDLTNLVGPTTLLPPELTFSAVSCNVLCVTNAQAAAGQVWIGRSHGPLDLPTAATSLSFNNIGNAFTGRPGVRPMSYFQLYTPHDIHAIPMDIIKYQDFTGVVPAYPGEPPVGLTFDNGMTPLILVFYPTGGTTLVPTNSTTYNLRICIEARVRYPTTSPNSSLHVPFAPTPQSSFDSIVSEAEAMLGGVVEAGEGALVGGLMRGVPGALAGGAAGFADHFMRQGRNGPRR